jgi:hypothetical protein
MSPKDIRPQNDMQALERRLETLELTLGELVAIFRRVEVVLANSILFKPRR